jgi:hypothetical protein
MSHFSAIGFTVTPEELKELAEQASREGTRVDSPHGGYFHWSPGAGVELWVQANKQEEIVGCNPHFAGAGRLPASIIETLNVPGRPLDGRCFGWAAPRDEKNPYSGLHALSADLPDFDFVEARILIPPIVTLQIAAFAEELECFPTETTFLESEAAQHHGAAAGQWIWRQQEIEEEPQSKVFLNGIVKQSEQRENPITGSPFIALLLRTEAGTIDVVVDPEIVPRRPVVGMVAAGTFWLSARVVSDLPPANEPPPPLSADSPA